MLGRSGRIDVLINNAGVLHLGLAEETTREAVLAVFETNFFGTVRLIHTVLPHMRSLRKGRIINVGSLASRVSEPGEAFYSASKCALAGYTEALRHEVWPLGIHVSLVEPGVFKTNVLQAALITEPGIQDYDGLQDDEEQDKPRDGKSQREGCFLGRKWARISRSSCSARRAASLKGPRRSLLPLPRTTRKRGSSRGSGWGRARSSEIRMPVA